MARIALGVALIFTVAATAVIVASPRAPHLPDAANVRNAASRGDVAFAAGGPDLIIFSMGDAQASQGDCTIPAGVRVTVKNIGDVPAPATVTRVTNGFDPVRDVPTPPIAAGGSASVNAQFNGGPFSTFTATADFTNVVRDRRDQQLDDADDRSRHAANLHAFSDADVHEHTHEHSVAHGNADPVRRSGCGRRRRPGLLR